MRARLDLARAQGARGAARLYGRQVHRSGDGARFRLGALRLSTMKSKLIRIAETTLCLLLAALVALFVSDVYPIAPDWQLKIAIGVLLPAVAFICIALSIYVIWQD